MADADDDVKPGDKANRTRRGRGGGALRIRGRGGGRGAGRGPGGAGAAVDAETSAGSTVEHAADAREEDAETAAGSTAEHAADAREEGTPHAHADGRGRGRQGGGGGVGRGGRSSGGGGGGGGGGGARVQGECKVSADSNIQKVSGFLAAGVRNNQPATVLAISDLAVNKAIKALALARNFLAAENLDLVAQPRFPEYDKAQGTAHMQLDLQAKQTRAELEDLTAAKMAVSQHSNPSAVAGAIASSVREGKHVTKVSSMGPQAVLRTVKAIFLARRYLRADNLDLSFVPEFADANGLTMIDFHVFAHAPAADAAQVGGSRAARNAAAATEPKA